MPESSLTKTKRGSLVVFEGCDHSGKTTQCSKLIKALEDCNEKVQSFKFPGIKKQNYLGKKIVRGR